MNKIKGLERKLEFKDKENDELKRKLVERDFQYAEMKKRALSYKQRLAMTQSANLPMMQPNMGQFFGFQPPYQQALMPRSVSNETVVCPVNMAS